MLFEFQQLYLRHIAYKFKRQMHSFWFWISTNKNMTVLYNFL